MQPDGNGYYCPVHQWQRVPVYMFALRVLLSDWEGRETWTVIFDELATKVLGFNANAYTGMTSDADHYASLSLLRGACVMVTIKKCVNYMYVNDTVSELEVVSS